MSTITPDMLREASQAKREEESLLVEKYMPRMVKFWKKELNTKLLEAKKKGKTFIYVDLTVWLIPRPSWPFWQGTSVYCSREDIQKHPLIQKWVAELRGAGFSSVSLNVYDAREFILFGGSFNIKKLSLDISV